MPKKRTTTFSLDDDTIQMLKQLAKDSHKSASQWITDSVWEKAKQEADKRFEEAYGKPRPKGM